MLNCTSVCMWDLSDLAPLSRLSMTRAAEMQLYGSFNINGQCLELVSDGKPTLVVQKLPVWHHSFGPHKEQKRVPLYHWRH